MKSFETGGAAAGSHLTLGFLQIGTTEQSQRPVIFLLRHAPNPLRKIALVPVHIENICGVGS